MREINIKEIQGFRIGNAEYPGAGTGCTVILPDKKALCACDIRGGAPASRETALLSPVASNDGVNAVLLSGGSAFGLDAASGVVRYLEERGIGFETDHGVVPIVSASCLFDLGVGSSKVRPDAALGYQACINAEDSNYQDGCFGAGAGCTVGKLLGPKHIMKSGIGSYAIRCNDLCIGAIVALNAAGDVFAYETGEKIAGCFDKEAKSFVSGEAAMEGILGKNLFRQNTTIAAIICNALIDKASLLKVAMMAHDGFARSIRPAHTMYDGDSIYALASGEVKADVNLLGHLSSIAISKAIEAAARPCGDCLGIPSALDVL